MLFVLQPLIKYLHEHLMKILNMFLCSLVKMFTNSGIHHTFGCVGRGMEWWLCKGKNLKPENIGKSQQAVSPSAFAVPGISQESSALSARGKVLPSLNLHSVAYHLVAQHKVGGHSMGHNCAVEWFYLWLEQCSPSPPSVSDPADINKSLP